MKCMVILCKCSFVHACLQGHHVHALSGCGIWEELKSNCGTHAQLGMPAAAVCTFCRVLRSTLLLLLSHNLDSQSVNRLPKSIGILPFKVVICVLFIAVAAMR